MPPLHNGKNVLIDSRKLTDYLLNINHREGGPKAAFLAEFDYGPDNAELLEAAIREHALLASATPTFHTKHGRKFETLGPLRTPDGRNPVVRVEWQYDNGSNRPRPVTRVPGSL